MSSNTKLAKELLRALEQRQKRRTTAIDTLAEVKRVEGDTIWVHVPGGPDETPIRKTISAKPGDKVQIRIAGGRGWASGNETSPPTDDTVAVAANRRAAVAGYIAGVADRKAEEARITARSKAKTFQTSDSNHPEPPYYAGDMWILTYMNDGERIRELYTCVQTKYRTDTFEQNDWQLSATDDATAAEALGIANSLLGWSEEIDSIITGLTTSEEFDMVVNDLSGRISDLDWYGYLNLYGRDGGTPVIELGSREKSSYVLITTPSNLGFYKNNGNDGGLETTATAYFGESATQGLFGLIAGVLEAQKYLTIGNFLFIANADGGLTIKKAGD